MRRRTLMKTGAPAPPNYSPATKDTAAPQKLHFTVEPKTDASVFPQIYKDVYISTQTYVLYSVFTYSHVVSLVWYYDKKKKRTIHFLH